MRSTFQRSAVARRFGTVARRSLAIAGGGAAVAFYFEYKVTQEVEQESKGDKKRLLELPFHRMKLVETKKTNNVLSLLSRLDDEEDDSTFEVEVRDLVDTIHQAAEDPNISGLCGTFGQGFRFASGGWAHVEEVRNALKVFRESHRNHLSPNLVHEDVLVRNGNATPKQAIAFADSFAHPMDPGNKEYYLASAFSHICLQKVGELNLFGLGASNTFFRSFFEKYGIKMHVFKHGKYKNAPNGLTENGYSKDHKKNVKNIVDSINQQVNDRIAEMRGLKQFDDHMWKVLHSHGTLSADDAKRLDLVDEVVSVNPVQAGRSETKLVSFGDYKKLLAKRKKIDDRSWKIHSWLKHLAEKSIATEYTLAGLGIRGPHYNIAESKYNAARAASTKEKVAIVNITGTINDALARKTVSTLQKIRKNPEVKCVILRVDSPGGSVTASETIFRECEALPQPVLCSMANVAASGGYYVASNCKRIFALPNTVTGSIGVFGVKADLTGFAARYGIKVQHIGRDHTFTNDPFHPLTTPMKSNLSRRMDDVYLYFKELVSQGRSLSIEQVEDIAQGRVWTGEQAKGNGLVDEIGGLTRAIAYARRNYTSGYADVEVWPKPPTLQKRLFGLFKQDEPDKKGAFGAVADSFLSILLNGSIVGQQPDQGSVLNPVPDIVLAADENGAIKTILQGWNGGLAEEAPLFPPDFWV